jgi:dipeptidyl aminopeptidase/acylaminoacyl peptidase
LSEDETLLAISHSEQGDSRHPDIRVINVATGETVADKTDGPGKGLDAVAFSPVLGDNRLLVTHERHGKEELLIWDVAQETERELALDLAGEVSADWYPDGQALLIAHTFQARDTLYRLDLATEELTAIDTPRGSIGSASVRPDGSIEYSWSNAAQARSIRVRTANSDDILLATPGKPAPEAYPLTDAFVQTPSGVVHALISRSEVSLPAPTIFAIHGGPHANDADYYSAYRAMWVDAGFTVVHVNYRGSTGYGSAWRDAIEGRPGLTELEDVKAVADWAVAEGIADPEKLVINGASWGGYLTLLALGLQPELWAVGVAGVPVADYVAAYEDEMEPLKAFDRALFGGTPEEKPGLYRECSPLTYVDQVTAPVIVLAGNNDPRCPIRQIHNYLDALVARDGDVETYFYDAGHGSYVIDETITQSMIELDFVRRKLG